MASSAEALDLFIGVGWLVLAAALIVAGVALGGSVVRRL